MATPSRSSLNIGSPTKKSMGTSALLAKANPYLATAKVGYDLYAGYKAGKSKEAMSRYNAGIIEQESVANQQAMTEQRRVLADDQRGLKATQRMSVAGRGGLNEGTDLLTLADEAEKMQLDQLELQRQQNVKAAQSQHAAYMTKFEAEQQQRAGLGATLGRWTKHLAKAYVFDFSGT
jgi:hypothetical protein